jgi:hypothetical protein
MRTYLIAAVAVIWSADAMACTSLPKLWVEDEPKGELRSYSLMVELPDGCSGTYEMQIVRNHGGNRNATRQRGNLPIPAGEPILLSSTTINDMAGVEITAEIITDTGVRILYSAGEVID